MVRDVRVLGVLAAGGVGCFAVAVVALHLLPTGLDPVGRTVSEYVNQPYGWLVPIAGAGIGVGSLALTAALRRTLPATRAVWLLGVWSVAMLVVAAFPTDPAPHGRPAQLTTAGAVHVVAGLVAFLALAVAAPVVGRALGGAPRVLGLVAPAGLLVFALTAVNRPPVSRLFDRPTVWGLGERVMVAGYVAWLLAAAWTVARRPGRRA